jgi:hypothetical protein
MAGLRSALQPLGGPPVFLPCAVGYRGQRTRRRRVSLAPASPTLTSTVSLIAGDESAGMLVVSVIQCSENVSGGVKRRGCNALGNSLLSGRQIICGRQNRRDALGLESLFKN